jgi:hypothetical protein
MSDKLQMPNVTLLAVTTRDHHETLAALLHSQQLIDFGQTVYCSDLNPSLATYPLEKLTFLKIPKFTTYYDICVWYLTEFPKLAKYIKNDYLLSIHWDGYPVRPEAWRDEFYDYDFIGSPLPTGEVGNNGFCFYSKKLIDAIAQMKFKPERDECHPSDQVLFRRHKDRLASLGVRIAPADVAFKFSTNVQFYKDEPVGYRYAGSFGFHGIASLPCMDGFPVQVMPQHGWHLQERAKFRLMDSPNLYTDAFSTRWLVPDWLIYGSA